MATFEVCSICLSAYVYLITFFIYFYKTNHSVCKSDLYFLLLSPSITDYLRKGTMLFPAHLGGHILASLCASEMMSYYSPPGVAALRSETPAFPSHPSCFGSCCFPHLKCSFSPLHLIKPYTSNFKRPSSLTSQFKPISLWVPIALTLSTSHYSNFVMGECLNSYLNGEIQVNSDQFFPHNI